MASGGDDAEEHSNPSSRKQELFPPRTINPRWNAANCSCTFNTLDKGGKDGIIEYLVRATLSISVYDEDVVFDRAVSEVGDPTGDLELGLSTCRSGFAATKNPNQHTHRFDVIYTPMGSVKLRLSELLASDSCRILSHKRKNVSL
jgi:hypothetical protein